MTKHRSVLKWTLQCASIKPREHSINHTCPGKLVSQSQLIKRSLRYTDEIFKISRVKRGRPTTYSIRGHDDQPIEGKFYSENFSKTRLDNETTARIEEVLKTRRRKGVREFFVKWVGMPAYLNRWIREDQLVPT